MANMRYRPATGLKTGLMMLVLNGPGKNGCVLDVWGKVIGPLNANRQRSASFVHWSIRKRLPLTGKREMSLVLSNPRQRLLPRLLSVS